MAILLVASCASNGSPGAPIQPEPTVPEPTAPEPAAPDVPEPTVPEPAPPEPAAPDVPEPTDPEPADPDPTAPEDSVNDPQPGLEQVDFVFSFDFDAEGWVAGFADIPSDYDQSTYELDSGHRALPEGLDGAGMYMQGHNRSDDLFMFLKRQVGGLTPMASYAVWVTVDLATNVPMASFGIGGSPGESVFVKVGAATVEPGTEIDSIGHLRMDIDKGNQSQGGSQMVVIGDLAHPDVLDEEFRIKTLGNPDTAVMVEADGGGNAWLIVGTDSGFEGLTRLYYDRISFTLTPVERQ